MSTKDIENNAEKQKKHKKSNPSEDHEKLKGLTLRRATSEPSMVGIGGCICISDLEISGLGRELGLAFGLVIRLPWEKLIDTHTDLIALTGGQ